MLQIPLINSDKFVTIDDEDAAIIAGYAWWEHAASPSLSYAYGMKLPRSRTGERVVKMHRLILGLEKGASIVDHIDSNGLNNVRSNLQRVTAAQNAQKANHTAGNMPHKRHSKFRGVSFLGWYGKYLAYVNAEGKRVYLGYYDTAEEAARVRDAKAKELHGKFARLNYEDD